MTKTRIKEFILRYKHILCILLAVFVFVTICSQSSFIYPFNTWVDPNCFFTVARAMANGKVLYVDIYEQKGLYLYAFHIFAYGISHNSFIGVYLLQLFMGFIYGLAVYKMLRLYVSEKFALLLIPVLIMATYVPFSYERGDSAEEFAMPMIAMSLLWLMRYSKGQKIGLCNYFAVGAFAAIIFWIKYTMLGFFFAFILLAFIFEIRDKRVKRAFLGVGLFVLGMFAASIPALVYFISHKALNKMFEAYIYNNIFLYSNVNAGQASNFIVKIGYILRSYVFSIGQGWSFYIPIIAGFIYFAASKKISRREKIMLFVTYGVTVFVIYIGGVGYRYYGQPICVYAFTGGAALYAKRRKLVYAKTLDAKPAFLHIASILMIMSVMTAVPLNSSTDLMFKKKDELVQYRFAKIINETQDATLLNYGCLDFGVYTAANIIPSCKYFCGLNIPLDDIKNTQDEWVKEGKVDYIVCYDVELPDGQEKYELIDQVDIYKLYALKERSNV